MRCVIRREPVTMAVGGASKSGIGDFIVIGQLGGGGCWVEVKGYRERSRLYPGPLTINTAPWPPKPITVSAYVNPRRVARMAAMSQVLPPQLMSPSMTPLQALSGDSLLPWGFHSSARFCDGFV
ncbi:hypothetical protein RRG08_022927 [Elysia crispata]|uniref:Uncharacterized protein n=1 Tax=Elysia crispata TaxID=231223 RepID=A0AAE1CJP4_9GAST|nr:hypothetical protein RRG08_022927 [Elysia crispata]